MFAIVQLLLIIKSKCGQIKVLKLKLLSYDFYLNLSVRLSIASPGVIYHVKKND